MMQVGKNRLPSLTRGLASCATQKTPAVNSFNEWDPLEEVIVGRVEHAMVPRWHNSLKSVVPRRYRDWFKENSGKSFPKELIDKAAKDLNNLSKVLEAEGVKVVRPDPVDWSKTYSSPDFPETSGIYGAMPRDFLLVVGNEIIEAPMAWRSRYFEFRAYRTLIKDYFKKGAKWTAAPKPQMSDDLYDSNFDTDRENLKKGQTCLTEFEPVFDAAEFSRCGRDIFCQQSQVTNRFGIEWLQRHLGNDYRIHVLEFDDPNAMHIDGTFVPMAPGRLLLNPVRPVTLPPMFKNWQIMTPPNPTIPDEHPLYFTSKWLTMNLLSIDTERVLVEENEKPMIDFLKKQGFKPVPVPFRGFMTFGGAFHCATTDVRRKGKLESYFD